MATMLGEQLQPAAQHHELAADLADRLAVILAEVGDGLEVRCQTPGQPHQLDVTLSFALQTPARLHAIEIAVDVDLEQDRWVV
jgi:hypothetical protein